MPILDQYGGVVSHVSYDEMTDTTIIKHVQDVNPILEQNKALQRENAYTFSKSMKRIASIPNNVTYQWLSEDGVYWPSLPKHEKRRYLARKLNSNEYRYLRSSEGRF